MPRRNDAIIGTAKNAKDAKDAKEGRFVQRRGEAETGKSKHPLRLCGSALTWGRI
jgi:hypothetical protein